MDFEHARTIVNQTLEAIAAIEKERARLAGIATEIQRAEADLNMVLSRHSTIAADHDRMTRESSEAKREVEKARAELRELRDKIAEATSELERVDGARRAMVDRLTAGR